jgi:hypothetical protein
MEKLRRLQLEPLVKQELPRGGSQQVLASHYLGDLHVRIIHHYRQLVGGDSIMTPYDKITEIISCHKFLEAATEVDKRNDFSVWHTKPPVDALTACRRDSRIGPSGATSSRIDWLLLANVRRLQSAQDILSRASAGVNEAPSA